MSTISAVRDLFTKPLTCPVGVAINDLVYVSGSGTVDKASASDPSTANFLGLVVEKPSDTVCIVQTAGENENLSGLVPGATYYLSNTPGQISTTPGTNPVVIGEAVDTTTLSMVPGGVGLGMVITTNVNLAQVGGIAIDLGQENAAGSIPVVLATDQTSIPAAVNANRVSSTLHRSNVTVTDKLVTPATPVLTAVTEAGSTLPAATYNVTTVAGNRWGVTTTPATAAVAVLLNQAVNVAFAGVPGATYYDIFLSTDAAPKWVGRITEAQRASGGFIISTVGVVTPGGSAPAGSVDIGIAGTGQLSNATNFANNTAYTPATPTVINCTGYSRAEIRVKVSVTDLRSAPSVTILPFWASDLQAADFYSGQPQPLNLLLGFGLPLEQTFTAEVNGASGLVVLFDTLSGQGTNCNVEVQLIK